MSNSKHYIRQLKIENKTLKEDNNYLEERLEKQGQVVSELQNLCHKNSEETEDRDSMDSLNKFVLEIREKLLFREIKRLSSERKTYMLLSMANALLLAAYALYTAYIK